MNPHMTGSSIARACRSISTHLWARPLCLAVAFCAAAASAAAGQAPQRPPAKGFILHDERQVDRFVVQRWVSEALPEVSVSGFCVCMTVVYEGNRKILSLDTDEGTVDVASSGKDITGDGRAELVVTKNSGGAHCCESTSIYSVEGAPREILSVSTGSCRGELVDLDKDGVPEFKTCDDTFANALCAFAFSPMPTVVFAYDKAKGVYGVATPRYLNAAEEAKAGVAEARKAMDESPRDAGVRRCAALAPALPLIYGGRVPEGVALFRLLYRRPDAPQIEQKIMELVRKSPLWIAQ
jgi:hypothetical protein